MVEIGCYENEKNLVPAEIQLKVNPEDRPVSHPLPQGDLVKELGPRAPRKAFQLSPFLLELNPSGKMRSFWSVLDGLPALVVESNQSSMPWAAILFDRESSRLRKMHLPRIRIVPTGGIIKISYSEATNES